MSRCPYATALWLPGEPVRVLAQCTRRRGFGLHLHSALIPARLTSARISPPSTVRIRWRSTNTPDYDVRFEQ